MTETSAQARPLIPAGMAVGQAVGQAQLVLTRMLSRRTRRDRHHA